MGVEEGVGGRWRGGGEEGGISGEVGVGVSGFHFIFILL